MCVCQRAGFSLGCIHLCIGKERAKASTHSQRVGALLWVALAQLFGGTLLVHTWTLLSFLCIWRNQPSWGGENGMQEAGVAQCPPPTPCLALLELSGLDCRVSTVIETLLCENHRGFPLSRNTGHLFWDTGYPESPFSTGQTEVLRVLLSLAVQVWG